MREDGVDLANTPEGEFGNDERTPAPGTGEEGRSRSPAEAQNTDRQNEPGPIPYSRFQEVNAERTALKERWGVLDEYGIEPDSAVRLTQFERAYQADPTGVLASMIDNLTDLPDSRKAALKELLSSQSNQTKRAGEGEDEGNEDNRSLPPEVKEALDYVRRSQERDRQAESNARLDVVLSHWKSLDEKDNIKFSDRQKLQYVQTASAMGGHKTLQDLSEAARKMALEDRDELLGGAIQRPRTERPSTVSGGGVLRSDAIVPKTMPEARKLIEADIAAGRFPDLSP
jgi:hypothetical protein